MGTSRRQLCVAVMVALTCTCARASVTDTIALDKRLEKNVTIEVVHARLADVAADLTKQTGVTIRAGTSAQDWKPRERKVTIFAEDVPAGDLIHEIAALLDFELTASGKEGQWEYRFWLDRKSRQAEDEAVAASEKENKERITKAYQAALDVADEALGLTYGEALAKRASSPWLAFLGGADTGRACAKILSYLNKQGADSRSQFLAGRVIALNVADMPAEVQQAVRQAAGGTLAGYVERDSDDPVEITSVTIQPSCDDNSYVLPGQMVFGCTAGGLSADDQTYEEAVASLPLVSPNSPLSKFIGEFALRVESGDDPASLEQEFEASLEKDGGLLRRFFDHDSPTRDNPPTDPELTRDIEIKKVGEEPSDPMETGCDPEPAGAYVREISRATGWPVLFESFNSLNNFPALIVPGKQPLYKVLIALEEAGYLWRRQSGILLVWPEDRLARRASEISEALVAHYERLWETQGTLSLDDHAALVSSLTDYQIAKGLWTSRLHGMFDPSICNAEPGYRDMLRLYCSLSKLQKALLVTEGGLPLIQLDGQQWQRMQTILADEMAGVSPYGGVIKLQPTDGYPALSIVVMEHGKEQPQVSSYQFCMPSKNWDDESMEEQQ